VAVQCCALWFLQRSVKVRTPDRIRPEGPNYEACPDFLDVVIVGRTFQEELNNLLKVFQTFRGARLKQNPEKCPVFQKEVWCPGHILLPDAVTRKPQNMEVVKRWPQPTEAHELRSYLVLCTCCCTFIVGLGDIAKPLTQLTGRKLT
jgi:hypothetical protein